MSAGADYRPRSLPPAPTLGKGRDRAHAVFKAPRAKTTKGDMRLWASVGGPIIGVLALIILAGGMLLSSIARDQDDAADVSAANLISRSLLSSAETVSSSTLDFGVWNDAFANISQRWNQEWVQSNMYSSAMDGLVVFHRDGTIRHIWISDAYAGLGDGFASALVSKAVDDKRLAYIANAKATSDMIARNFLEAEGRLVVVATAPVRSELRGVSDSSAVVSDFVMCIQILDAPKLVGTARSIGAADLKFTPGATPPPTEPMHQSLRVPNHRGDTVGWFSVRREKPGSAAFARRAAPIAAVLLLLGGFASLASLHLVRRQLALTSAARAAEAASNAKSSFLANMSHELRTPLNAVIGYAEIIEENCAEAQRADDAEDSRRIQRAAHHLLGLINDILEHSRIDAKQVALQPEQTAIAPLLNAVGELVKGMAERNGNVLAVQCDADIGDAYIDPLRLKQCLVNLAGNAVKFTSRGNISLSASHATLHSHAAIRFEVTDTGIGMSNDVLAKLFNPFVQADGSITRKYGGTGLGLAITRGLVESMGGVVNVTSTPGVGSRFTMIVPRGSVGALSIAA